MISVIIPAYNAEKFLNRSAESVLAQSYTDLELLIVNDGSKDATAAVAAQLAERDSRVRVFSIENSGPAMARNYALGQLSPRSEYVCFLDADDALTPDALAYALTAAEKGADFVMFGFTICNSDGTKRDYFENEGLYDEAALGAALPRLYMANMLNQVWAKLYRTELIQKAQLRFPDYRWGEDRLFNFDVLENAKRCAVLPACKYLYILQSGESLINRFYDRKLEVCRLADLRMQELCRRFCVEDDAPCRYMFLKSVFSCLTTLYAPSCTLSTAEKRAYFREVLNDKQIIERSEGMFGGSVEKFMCAVMRSGNLPLNRLLFKTVYLSGKLAPKLFLLLKHKK